MTKQVWLVDRMATKKTAFYAVRETFSLMGNGATLLICVSAA
jgi:hypothetical protein